jgi:ABC-2 type transport system ATP-binding protein
MIELRHVCKDYGAVPALRDVTATVQGTVVGLLGPNGAGKSTLLKVLLGLIGFRGEALVLGMSSRTDAFAIRDRIGYMPEMDCYLSNMNAVELCTYAGELAGLPRREAMQRAHAALSYCGLEDKRYQLVTGYSTGLKQRVKLAQALVHDPELLFLDEPTNGLDPRARGEMLEFIAELPRRRRCSIILSSHLLPDIERVCDHVIIMQAGALRYAGPIARLRGDHSEATVRFRVEVKSDVDALAARLTAAGCQVELAPPLALILTLPDGADTRLVFHQARLADVQLRHLAPQTLSLEAAFLRELGSEP